MKIKNLIEILKKLDPDGDVDIIYHIADDEYGDSQTYSGKIDGVEHCEGNNGYKENDVKLICSEYEY